jgi:hypothetical protein
MVVKATIVSDHMEPLAMRYRTSNALDGTIPRKFSKALHIWFAGFLYAMPLGLFIGYKLQQRGDLSVQVLGFLAVGLIVTGTLFGFVAWHVWFKRHQL